MFIPSEAQENIENLSLFFMPAPNLRIYQNNQLMYGYRAGSLTNNFEERSFFDLLEALETASPTWEITGGGSLLYPSVDSSYQLAASPFRLGLGVKRGELSLGQALCGYWHLQGILPRVEVAPELMLIKEELETLCVESELIELKSQSSEVEPDVTPTPAPSLDPSSRRVSPLQTSDPIWQQREWIEAIIREQSMKRYLALKNGKMILAIGGDILEFKYESERWQYDSGYLSPESLIFIQQIGELNEFRTNSKGQVIDPNQSSSESSVLEFY
ncbi:hypothetical protein [Gloeothece verrucosa]|uniref:Uncharacterized protein n=1 Tax=Gloeothece verrucosa (strain PCC 7822) TaxID=497965 RepID=E0UM97_GLOV7|nr:hypothetical protein [Gloeothece verrucosa]ADN18077.1 hypothetical protein Cyan7822_6277 [Gloeothece verrucosa PCC 7822]